MATNPLRTSANKTLKFLKDAGLLTDEHEATQALLKALCDEFTECTNSTQRAGISREIRACLESLPKPIVKVADEAQEFLDALENV